MPLASPRRARRLLRSVSFLAPCACILLTAPHIAGAAPSEPPPANAPTGTAAAVPPPAQPLRSALDGQLFYQVLIGELELRQGQPGPAYQIMLDAARRTRNEQLFKRTVEIALRAQAGQEALAAAKAWRTALPESRTAVEFTAQILLALNRPAEAVEPLRALISRSAFTQRAAAVASIPRAFARVADKRQAATLIDEVTQPFREEPVTGSAAWTASARGWFAAGETPRALDALQSALDKNPADEGAALLAIEMMPTVPQAEALVQAQLRAKPDSAAVRLPYARRLIETQRMAPAAEQLEAVTQLLPQFAGAWLTLGAVRIDLRQPEQAEVALRRFLDLRQATVAAAAAAASAASDASGETDAEEADAEEASATADDDAAPPTAQATFAKPTREQEVQAYVLLSQAAEQRGRLPEAQAWLERIPSEDASWPVQMRRAVLLQKQGKTDQAVQLVRQTPAANEQEERSRFLAQSMLLREANRWKDAYTVLGEAVKRFPDDTDLLYEQAMVADKLRRHEDMERLLRHILQLKPDHHNALNALGFGYADRNERLDEAKKLIQRALELAPGDPFITDSLAWVEFRMGNVAEAQRLLQEAFRNRPDPEIAAHLGEVLWTQGQKDEARRIWREAQQKDAENATLKDTMRRFRAR